MLFIVIKIFPFVRGSKLGGREGLFTHAISTYCTGKNIGKFELWGLFTKVSFSAKFGNVASSSGTIGNTSEQSVKVFYV